MKHYACRLSTSSKNRCYISLLFLNLSPFDKKLMTDAIENPVHSNTTLSNIANWNTYIKSKGSDSRIDAIATMRTYVVLRETVRTP